MTKAQRIARAKKAAAASAKVRTAKKRTAQFEALLLSDANVRRLVSHAGCKHVAKAAVEYFVYGKNPDLAEYMETRTWKQVGSAVSEIKLNRRA